MTEKQTTYLNKENHPCKYNNTPNLRVINREAFVNCSKMKIWENVKPQMNCIWLPLKTFIPSTELCALPKCPDEDSAKTVGKFLFKFINKFIINSSTYGCPIPCMQTHFQYDVQYFHRNVDNCFYDEVDNIFYISVFYKSLEKDEFDEMLVYDHWSFLATTGGNLGLLLDLSGMSIFFYLIRTFKKYLQRDNE